MREAIRHLGAYRTRRLDAYSPKPHQAEFHALGATHRERALLASNQSGKTICGGMEGAMHATGRYPRGWKGIRYDHPTKGWVANTNLETTRDNPQRVLLGEDCDESLGTGAIPKECLGKLSFKQIPGAVDRVLVRHVSGGWSRINFKAYDQRRERWQGETLDWIWCDEEAPSDVYSEALARISKADDGRIFSTLTPLLGMSQVVGYFYPKPSTEDRALVQTTLESCGLYTEEQIQKITAAYQPHERDARTKGIPMLGRGRIFPVAESAIVQPWRQLSKSWPWLIGMDFGWDHPTAAVKCAYDREHDRFYVTEEYAQEEALISLNAAGIKAIGGAHLPVVWPHDGWRKDVQSGEAMATLYRKAGLRMWPEHVTFPDGSRSLISGLGEMLDRMRTGRWVVFDTCQRWIEEFRLYHRKPAKDGTTEIVALKDDLLSASRYAMMMRRVARADEDPAALTARRRERTLGSWDPLELDAGRGWNP